MGIGIPEVPKIWRSKARALSFPPDAAATIGLASSRTLICDLLTKKNKKASRL